MTGPAYPWLLLSGLGLGLVGIGELMGGTDWLGAGLVTGALTLVSAGLVSVRRSLPEPELARAVSLTVRAGLLVATALGLSAWLSGVPAGILVSGRDEDRIDEVLAWARRIPGPLGFTVVGRGASRSSLAASAWLERLGAARGQTRVVIRDPDADPAWAALSPRPPRPGEVEIEAGGRRTLARDASPRALAGALRALADPRSRRIRFVWGTPGPGAPPGYRKAAAAAAAELGVDALYGPPDPGSRVWVLGLPGSPEPETSVLEAHLLAGGSLLFLAEGVPGAELKTWLGSYGIQVGAGFFRDVEEGPGRPAAAVRVGWSLSVGTGAPEARPFRPGPDLALLPGARVVAGPPGTAVLTVAPGADLTEGEGSVRSPEPGESPGLRLRGVGKGGWLAVIGDAGFASDPMLGEAANRELWLELCAEALDGELGLPASVRAPLGGVDPALDASAFARFAWCLCVVQPGFLLGFAVALAAARRRPVPAPVAGEVPESPLPG